MADKSLYLVYGDDEYLVSSKAREIVERLVPPDKRDMGLDIVDGSADLVDDAVAAVNACLGALRSPGLFSTEKVVWLKDVTFLGDNRVGGSATVKNQVGYLTDLIKKGLPPEQTLVISARKVDKRRAFFKACKAAGEIYEFIMPDKSYQADKVAGQRLNDFLAEAGLQMSGAVKDLFLAKVGNNTRNLVNEVEKLATYLGGGGKVTLADVRAIVSSSREAIAWDLADAVGLRDLPRALSVLRQLVFQKENIIGIVIGLENRIRDLIFYREALAGGWLRIKPGGYGTKVIWSDPGPEIEELLSEQMSGDPRKIHPFRAGKLAEQAAKFSRKRLRYCLREVTKAHAELVSSRVPQEMTLELLIIKMLAVAKKRGAVSPAP